MTERRTRGVYWTIRSDERLATIYPDDRHLATWLRLLLAADAMWPAPADVPGSVRKASVAALEAAGVIELLPGGLFRFHGLDAERGRRRDAAATSAARRYGSERTPNAARTQPGRDPDGMLAEPRRAETSLDEQKRTPPPPAKRGSRADGSSPRATGTAPRLNGENPRATGKSVRQIREDRKTGPTAIGEILRKAAAAGKDAS